MTGKQYLQQAYSLDKTIESDLRELARLRDLRTSIPGGGYGKERVAGGKTGTSRTEDVVIKIIDLESKINHDIDRLIDTKRDMIDKINQMEDSTEQLILRYRYINFMPWEVIKDELGYTDIRWVFRLHARALDSFERLTIKNH